MNTPKLNLPKRNPNSHKGQNGTVLAVGGSQEYPGAITLAGLAALRSGCDLVKVIAPWKVAWAINAYSPDLITIKAKGSSLSASHFGLVTAQSKNADVILFGNGIGILGRTKKLCRRIANLEPLKVVDADGIKSLCMDDLSNSITTPHSRELEILLGNSKISREVINRISNEKNISKKSKLIKSITQEFLNRNNVILLKGKIDAIISKNIIIYVKGGNAGMTKGGTGDVLAGLCAGFLAQSKDLVQSAINASIINKKIADLLLKKKKRFTYLASDMVEEIATINYPKL